MRLNTNSKKNNKVQTSLFFKKTLALELLIIFSVTLVFGYLVFSLVSQVYSLNLELKNLVSLVQSLQENQINLKSQLSTKDQEIKLLENTLENIKVSSMTTFNESQNFDLLKKEIIKSNNETSQFIFKTGGLIVCAFFIFKLVKRLF